MFRMRRTPKISVSPTDSRNRMAANTKPSTMMMVSVAIGALSLLDSLLLERLEPLRRLYARRWHDLLPGHLHHPIHDGEAVLGGKFAQSDNARVHSLMVGTHGHRAEWRFPGQAFKGLDHLVGFWPATRLVNGFFVSHLQARKGLVRTVRRVVGVAAKAGFIGLHKFLLQGVGLRIGMQEISARGSRHGNHPLGCLILQILEGLL